MELFGRISRQSVDVLVIVEVVGDIAHVTAPFTLQLIGGGVSDMELCNFFSFVLVWQETNCGAPRGMPDALASSTVPFRKEARVRV
eukprot:scaffold1669_cov99-Skeletonema_dohrnii-CCMP3373.AAC.3